MSKERANPCYQCADRHAACHSHCSKYIGWKKEHDERKAMQREETNRKQTIEGYYRAKRKRRGQ